MFSLPRRDLAFVVVYGLWRKAHQAYMNVAPAPVTLSDADALVTVDAALCTPIGVQILAHDAISSAQMAPASTALRASRQLREWLSRRWWGCLGGGYTAVAGSLFALQSR